ncbi:periplasmic heavy metal sensor [Pseudooceanicola algae]|uniref:Periplasmic heavy metal sensor n=1 Tax=Pseudooceanicola algae TaxID=1537215 RepID=A0A418SCF9_9RHOB|nr:periplasmic heavy metal sensor [Pseudooceanicola algae]QPM90092.1 hypothetical protein PSAL_013260 [Pseudooceanicola algae]
MVENKTAGQAGGTGGPEQTPGPKQEPTQSPTQSMGLRIAFFISLALNLAVAGLVIGAVMRGPSGPGPGSAPPPADRVGGVIAYALSREDRREIGREIGRELRSDRPERDDVRAEFDKLLMVLRAEPFDPDALEVSVQRQLDEAMRRQALGQKVLLERIAGMSRADRLAVADRLEEALSQPPADRHK